MKNSTKWFLVILGGLVAVGMGMTLLFLLLLKMGSSETEEIRGNGEKIAIVELQGEIFSSEEPVKLFKKYSDDSSIKAILFRVDSPGGGVGLAVEAWNRDLTKTIAA